jgi:hypothetical protein
MAVNTDLVGRHRRNSGRSDNVSGHGPWLLFRKGVKIRKCVVEVISERVVEKRQR